ncbi:MAG: DUF4168 domain-containing protein [Alphaproteobacteria bacterium]|nr:DUF4168 domain-containing protein [Alphaproteobacteria bacterium]
MKEHFEKILFIVAGIFLKHIWEKIRNRVTYLNYSVWHQSLGTSITDNLFGNVQILYNNNPVSSLYFTTLMLENHSSRDIENIEVNIYCDQASSILISHGYVELSPNALKFSDEYHEMLKLAQTDSSLWTNVISRRDYNIPVINRGDTVKFQLLTTNPTKQPEIYANCDQAGIKLKYAVNLKDFKGETSKHCAWVGTAIALTLCYPLIIYVPNDYTYLAIIAGTFLGLYAMYLGWLVIKFLKTFLRVIG